MDTNIPIKFVGIVSIETAMIMLNDVANDFVKLKSKFYCHAAPSHLFDVPYLR